MKSASSGLLTLLTVVVVTCGSALSAAIYSSDFESDNGGLVGTNDWAWGAPNGFSTPDFGGPEPVGGNSGSNAWGTVIGGMHSPSTLSTLTLSGLDLTGAGTLTFFEFIDSGSNSFDTAKVFVGASEIYLSDGNSLGTWREVTLDLGPFSGVQDITWTFSSTGVVERIGWYVDDVEVAAIPVPATALFMLSAVVALGAARRRRRNAAAA